MRHIGQIYIDGAFVRPYGTEVQDLINPATGKIIGRVTLGNAEDVRRAVEAAKRAFPAFARISKRERIALLRHLHDTVRARTDALTLAAVQEYGGPITWTQPRSLAAAAYFADMATVLENYEFTRRIRTAEVVMEPLGVAGLITPWNSSHGFICSKLATAIAAGCTAVIKPSELSAIQTQVLLEALHEAGVPPGVFNIVNGRGDVVGAEITAHPDIAKISFTGSTVVGKGILRTGAQTMKRVTLELGGKSPTVILDDADFAQALPLAIAAGFQNSGQACIAGTRILVPQDRMEEACRLAAGAIRTVRVGDPRDPATAIGPMVSRKQYDRVQRYIRLGLEEGARLIVGGEGHPEGLEDGFFVKPTLFGHVSNDMTIARDEIFGPVLCLLGYRNEEEAVAMANDTTYGLQAYVISSDAERARAVASRLQAGRVLINGLHHEPLAPFGGFKQSGLGREFGAFGLEAFLEPKTVLGAHRAA
jgi:NAD-dependent aldehyde dehydrogenases